MLKTLGKTSWDKIEINEVFAWDWYGDWTIVVRLNKTKNMELTSCGWNSFYGGEVWTSSMFIKERIATKGHLYKLPISTQRLWREDWL